MTGSSWPKDRKHFFILSSAGKPVYSRYGDESVISSYLGVAQAIISSFESSGDQIRCINAGRHRFVFLNRHPLYLLTVSTSGESESQLRGQLFHLYNQLLSILTAPQLARLFNKRINFDLRRLLAGTEKLFDAMVDALSMQSITELKSVLTARLDASLRHAVTQAFKTAHVKEAGYAALFINNRMVTYAHPRKQPLHPFDLHILTNMVTTSTNYGSGETWTPLCLPRLNRTAFVSAYISYIAPHICFVAVSHDKDAFFALSHYQTRLREVGHHACCIAWTLMPRTMPQVTRDVGLSRPSTRP
ncbi:vacuolar fusion protein MON1 [Syncephalis pseudoplumigaleata]|uniref:Vacuolar fusion protein MON1 n=1 Tax=Syncephalis pseudoplumigaleata TaxID=1712513 RepID=A0A4P9YVZ5_9FUNG|nr:vacuolar fusion protein MON1 [Syncephalis pseudoplumigaleata]|eukprot:RKP24253.1 vacuolar fusion protein MON1 [Syncephalis pseudoplumigaleata]